MLKKLFMLRNVIHKDYINGNENADLMIIKLKRHLKFLKTIYPICLASSKPDLTRTVLLQDGVKRQVLKTYTVFNNRLCMECVHKYCYFQMTVVILKYCMNFMCQFLMINTVHSQVPGVVSLSGFFNITETICEGRPDEFSNVCKVIKCTVI